MPEHADTKQNQYRAPRGETVASSPSEGAHECRADARVEELVQVSVWHCTKIFIACPFPLPLLFVGLGKGEDREGETERKELT